MIVKYLIQFCLPIKECGKLLILSLYRLINCRQVRKYSHIRTDLSLRIRTRNNISLKEW